MPAWNFPNNNYGIESGLDTSDMEMFKRDPMASLAREICQNSLDAALTDASESGQPVIVEFTLFEITRDVIPGVDNLAMEIDRCCEYKGDSPKEGEALMSMRTAISAPIVRCMRISDFNTTGITGVETTDKGTPFYNLTKGSGVSDKGISSGGSKGIGKFASFVVSTTNTVFYSTLTQDGHEGYLGISKLRSVPIVDDHELMTTGTGYFGETERNRPVQQPLILDPQFVRAAGQTGTDVYLIGFAGADGWQKEIIAKVLESFMVAIMRGHLEVRVDGMLVNSDTVRGIVESPEFDTYANKRTIRGIRAQFELLTGADTKTEMLTIAGDEVTLYMMEYAQAEEAKATKQCVMVRYPYMKITHITTGSRLPFSALCVIERGPLNDMLREIENPQHTDWEIKRLNGYPEKKRATQNALRALKSDVSEFIREQLRIGSGESTDMVGAGEFLPAQEEPGENPADETEDAPIIGQIKRVDPEASGRTGREGSQAHNELEHDGGTGEDEAGRVLGQGASIPQPAYESVHHPADDTMIGNGDAPSVKRRLITGIDFKIASLEPNGGMYLCAFTSPHDEEGCEFQIRMCGDSNDRYPIAIEQAVVDDAPAVVKEGRITGLKLTAGQECLVAYTVQETEPFAMEVVLYAHR